MSYAIRTQKTWNETLAVLAETFRKWGVRDWTVIPVRIDGRKSWWDQAERKVTVVFTKGTQDQRFSLASQERPVDNLRALYLGLESMRMNETRGIGDVVREMYLQLPAPSKGRDPYEVLGIRSDAPLEVIEASWRALAKRAHPDAGGSDAAMKEINAAWEKIKADRGAASPSSNRIPTGVNR